VLLGGLLGGSAKMAAQSLPAAGVSAPVPRVLADWRGSAGVAIAHSKPSMNPAAIDLGPAPANQSLGRMILLLAPSPAQQQALAAELASLQNPSSPTYHRWLTPQAFALSYANHPSDVAAVAAWLESQGFAVAPLPAGLGWIEFSGTVAQVQQAFGTQVDMIAIPGSTGSGNTRALLTTNIMVPGALSPVIAGLVSLDGVLSMPALTAPQPLAVSAADLASLTSPASAAAFTPHLAAQLLNVTPLTTQGVNGAGQTIAIVSRSNINSADVAAFRSAFALPASPLDISVNGPDPGLVDDQAEATLAASWAGAAAPGAQILLAPAATTAATDGVDLSLAAIIDQDLANVIAVGYSACEAALSPAHQAFYSALSQQAAAEGITVIAAAGDGGAAACTPAGGTVPVDTGLGVNALASTPWNTAVGVAAYGAGGAAAGTSALTAWSPTDPANPAYAPADPAYASGGGSSTLYSRKIWQPIPAELATASSAATNSRFLPDLALPTALDSTVNPGLAFCLSGSATASGCTLVRSGGSGVATAFFAGVAALINQKNGVQGNLAPSLYATSRAFNDVAQGTAKLACVPGSSGCDATGLIGYAAGSGYDLATGLGVPDVEKLVTELAKPLATGATPTIVLSITPVQANHTYNPSALVTFTARVIDPASAGIPTGVVSIYDSANYDVLTPDATLSSSGSAATGSSATFGPMELSSFYNYSGPESYNLGIIYSGDSTYPSEDPGYLLSVTSELSPTVLTVTPSSNSPALGSNITVTVTLGIVASGPPAGSVPPSGAVTLTVNGVALNPVALSTTGSVTSAVFTVPITATSNSIVASYPGDSNYGSSTSNPLLINLQGFTLTASPSNPPTNLNLTKGGAGSESFVITGVGGYTGLVQVICTVPTQDDMTCAVSPQQVTPTATVTFVVQTYITGGPLYASLGKPRLPGPLWPQAAGGAMLAGVLFFLLPFGRRARVFLRQAPRRFIILLMLLAGLAGTGIGCSSPSTTVTDIGTPLGVATLRVTATAYVNNAVVAQTINFTVNVQPQ
jgi:subtilase family serine protease